MATQIPPAVEAALGAAKAANDEAAAISIYTATEDTKNKAPGNAIKKIGPS